MHIKIVSKLLGATVLVSLLSVLSAYSMLVPTQTMESAACNSCHLWSSSVDITADPALLASQELLCADCHAGALIASHPSGVTPSMAVPATLPLDWKGDVTCSSCHLVHSQIHGALRAENAGAPFCESCHPQTFFASMVDGGTSTIISGHLGASGVLQDPYSIECMSCHIEEGEAGQEFPVSVDGQGNVRHRGANHPVGGSYESASSYGGYRPISQLHENIVLPNGLISCVSCHLGYSETHGELVTLNDTSALCYQCHQL